MAQTLDSKAIRKLTISQRLKLMDLIWDSLVDDDADMPLSPQQSAEIRRRRAELISDPSRGVPHSEMKKKLRGLK